MFDYFSKEKVPIDQLFSKIKELEESIVSLREQYHGALNDIKRLEEENIETTNCIYELSNQIDAVDSRIDILASEPINLENYNLDK
jgi:uncharacterized coiled-coil DUF342 family protein